MASNRTNQNTNSAPLSSTRKLLYITLGTQVHVPTAEFFRTLRTNVECVEVSSSTNTPIENVLKSNSIDDRFFSSVVSIIVAIGSKSLDLSGIFSSTILQEWKTKYAIFSFFPPDISSNTLPEIFRSTFTCVSVSPQVNVTLRSSFEKIRSSIKQKIKLKKTAVETKAALIYVADLDGHKAVSELGDPPTNQISLIKFKCDSDAPGDKFKDDVKGVIAQCQHVIVVLTNESWNNKRWSHTVASAIKANKKIITIHDSTSVKRFPSDFPEAVRPILHEIAIKFIHQRSKACWNKIIKRIKKTGVENIQTDVFLSHKQSSGQGIALALYNQLTSKLGLNPFLDVKAKFNLHDLKQIVSQTKLFVFILSEGIFDSYWCWQELQSAIENQKKVVFVCDSNYDPTSDSAKIAASNIKWQRLLDYVEFPAKKEDNTLLYDANYIADCASDIAEAIKDQPSIPSTRLYNPKALEVANSPKLYVMGGKTEKAASTNSVEVWQEKSQWKFGAPLRVEREYHQSVVFQNRVVVVGGNKEKSAEIFTNNVATQIADMNMEREKFGLQALGDKIYAFGGRWGSSLQRDSMEVYDPSRNTWTILSQTLPTPLNSFGSTSWENTILLGGGWNVLNLWAQHQTAVYQYDPRQPKWNNLISLPEGCAGLQMVTLNNDIYCIGGHNGTIGLNRVIKFDIRNPQWTEIEPMKKLRSSAGAVVHNGKIIVLGGRSDVEDYQNTVEMYDPQATTPIWNLLQSMKQGRYGMTVVSL